MHSESYKIEKKKRNFDLIFIWRVAFKQNTHTKNVNRAFLFSGLACAMGASAPTQLSNRSPHAYK